MYMIVYLHVWLYKSPTFSQSQFFYPSHLIYLMRFYLYQKKYVVILHFFQKTLASVMTSVRCLFTGSMLPPWGSWWVELRSGQCTTPEQAQLRRLKTRVARSAHFLLRWTADWLLFYTSYPFHTLKQFIYASWLKTCPYML